MMEEYFARWVAREMASKLVEINLTSSPHSGSVCRPRMAQYTPVDSYKS